MYNPNFMYQHSQTMAPAQYQPNEYAGQPQTGYIQPPAYPAPAPFQPSVIPTQPVPAQPQAAPFMPPTAGYSQPAGGAYALPQGGAGATVPAMAYGMGGQGAGATPLGAQGPSFAGGSFYPQAQGAGATPLGAQGPSYAGDVYQQIAGINQRLDQIGMSFGRPGGDAQMSGHEFLASVIAPEPAVPNNYLGGYGDGKLIPTVGTNNSGR